MSINFIPPVGGDLPFFERQRGGHRTWITDDRTNFSPGASPHPSVHPEEDDFEALKKEALQGVKGRHKQERTVVLPGAHGEGVEVLDVTRLDREARRSFMDRVLREGEGGDNLPLLKRVAARLERVGLRPPKVTVRFCDLSVLSRMIVGDRSLPTLKKTVSRKAEPALRALGRGPPKTLFPIIDHASGVIRPGVFTILLGPPGSGKSTFLQTLSGQTRRQRTLKVQAQELSYNGRPFHDFVVERSAAYVSQSDVHYGELTVRETLEFSARCQSTGYKKALQAELAEREAAQGIAPDPEVEAYMKATALPSKGNLIVEIMIKLLGLDVCADTVVGNAMLRGISGGQRKRVTTGEMVVGPVRALFADEISTGLDSNTTFQIMRALGNFTRVMQATTVVGLLQPQPETFDLFDEVILLSSGKVCYHGPVQAVLPFFEGLGFYCPPRRGVADFLQEVTLPGDQAKYWDMRNQRPHRYITAAMIEGAFKRGPHWQGMEAELAKPFDPASADPQALATTKYGQSSRWLLRNNFRRTLTLQRRNRVFSIIRTSQVILMAFVVATLFWREDKNNVEDGNLFFSVIFYSILYQLLGGISEMHLLVDRLSVFFKQRDVHFYPGWCFAVPTFVMRVPWSFLEAALWTHITYWLVGFSPSVRMLMFWFQLFLINIWSVSLFQLIAAVCRDDTVATSVGSLFLLLFINLTGFVLNKNDIPPWWIWGFWANPFAWVTRALAINEFTSSNWARPDPGNPSAPLGLDVLRFRGFPSEYWWVWVSVGFVLGTLAIILALFVAALTYLSAPKQRRVISPEALEEFELSRRQLITPQPSLADAAERGLAGWPSTVAESGSLASDSPRKAPGRVTVSALSDSADGAGSAGFQPRPSSGYRGTLGQPPAGGALQMTAFAGAAAGAGSFSSAGREPLSPRHAYLVRASQRISQASQHAEVYRQRTAIRFDPAVVTFSDVEYSVPLPPDADPQRADVPAAGPHAGQLRLLKGIDGAFRPGVLTALMGASGAGKTTLMDCLAGRKTAGLVTGDIRVNGFPKEPATFARVMGYVEQTDVHVPQTTVEEALHFSARLRLPTTVDSGTRVAFVEEIMALVELDRLRHAHVGVPGVSGLSVEQRKRLTLAVELVANPSIVFMDEPTSGLDARAAGIVMDAIRSTVDTGRTVVCTIHQPSIDIFEAFDELLLLKPGGATIYSGPLGDNSEGLISFFQAIPGVQPCPERYNPANWMLEVSSPASEAALNIDFADVYRQSSLAKEMGTVISKNAEPRPGAAPLQLAALSAPGPREQLLVNLRRNFTIYNRAPEYNLTRALITILVGFAFGTMFWRLGDNRTTVAGVLNICGVLFSSTLFVGISNCLTIQHLISAQRTVFYRERAAGMYGVLPFGLAQQLVEIPYLVVQAAVYSCIVYWMVWFARDAGLFFWWFFYFFLTLSYFTTLGIAAVNLTPSVPLSNVLCSFFFGFWNLLSGFLIPIPQTPGYWVWASWINPVQWSIYGMSISQLGGFSNEYITNLQGVTQSIPAFLSGRFQWETYMKGPIVAILFAYILAFSALAIFALKYVAPKFQKR